MNEVSRRCVNTPGPADLEGIDMTGSTKTALEWLAALLVVVGVAFMIGGHRGSWVLYVAGIVLLTFGVRLAIDCGKRG